MEVLQLETPLRLQFLQTPALPANRNASSKICLEVQSFCGCRSSYIEGFVHKPFVLIAKEVDVRWFMRMLALGLVAGACSLPAIAGGKAGKPDAAPCGDHGTSLHFEKSPKEAATKAAKEEKLVFVVHVSGIFEETDLT